MWNCYFKCQSFSCKAQTALRKKHSQLKNKDINYFRNKYQELKERRKKFESFVSEDHKNALIVSYKVSFRIAQHGEAHAIAENLIKPCAKDLVESTIGKNYVCNIESMPLSINIVFRRITDLSE